MEHSNRKEDDPVSVQNNVTEATQNDANSSALLLPPNHMRLLKLGLDRIASMRRFRCLKKSLNASHTAVATIGLAGILKKFDSYKNADEFLADIETLVQSYTAQYEDDTNIKKAAESLNEMARRQVTCIKTCAECFEYWANDVADFFSRVCTKPHLICYAKMDGYPYWPAKVLRINGGMANCEFFGDHSQADIPLTHCFLYSEEFDGKNTRNRSFNKALEELNLHIAKIVEKFGSFNPAQYRTGLSSKNADKQLMEMIPGAFDANKLVAEQRTSKIGDVGGASCESRGTSSSKVASPDTKHPDTINEKRPAEEQIKPKKRVRIVVPADSSYAENDDIEMPQNDDEPLSVPKTKADYSDAAGVPVLTKAQIEEMVRELHALQDDKEQFEQQLRKLNELKMKAKNQIKLCDQGMWNLKHQIAMSGNALTCASCGTISTGQFYCNDECRNSDE